MKLRGEIYSDRFSIPSGRRTYFFNVKRNREGHLFLNLVESLKKFDGRFERQEIVIYGEHIEDFQSKFNAVINKFLEIDQKSLESQKDEYSDSHSHDQRNHKMESKNNAYGDGVDEVKEVQKTKSAPYVEDLDSLSDDSLSDDS